MPAKIEIPKEELERLYWKEGLSILESSKKLEIGNTTFREKLIQNNIQIRPPYLPPKQLPINFKLNNSFFYILGVLHGDGCIYKNSFRLEVKDKDFANNVIHQAELLGFSPKCYKTIGRTKHNSYKLVTINSKNFINILKEYNFATINKKDFKISFLNGFLDSEGSIKANRSISISNTNLKILQNLQHFLKTLKIYSTISGHELYIKRRSSLLFAKYFHFSIKRKQDRLDDIVRYYKEKEVNHA